MDKYFLEVQNEQFLEGYNFFIEGEYREAINCFNKLISKEKPSAFYYYWRGQAHYSANLIDLAKWDYLKALEQDADQPIIYFSAGLIFYYRKSFDLAEEWMKNSIRSLDDNAPIFGNAVFDASGPYLYLGNIFCFKKDINLAYACYKKAIQLNNDCLYAVFNLAILYWAEEKFDDALVVLDQAISLGSDTAVFLYSFIKKKSKTVMGRPAIDFIVTGFEE
ncbi:tetratricopeptide repeat protein [Adhaeribacter terreus]|uniref:Tetratricopeptide repeat protein n=1 Tax=Adhaeribacter terreus TaxID=529703 RepID=A0ABW0EBD0_9BACT